MVNESASTIQDNTGTTGLVSEPQLELTAILRVSEDRVSYVGSAMSLVGNCMYLCAIKE